MFPYRDDNPHFLTPYGTYSIIAINVLVWGLVQRFGANPALAESICNLGLIPGELLETITVGTRVPVGPNSVCVLGNATTWYTPITAMFLHGGWLHLIGNMWFMWLFGNNVEDSMGTPRFILFYILAGLIAAGFQVAADPTSAIPMVGASGAIGGVMGAYILLYPRVNVHMLLFLGFFITTFTVPAVVMLGYWFAIQILSGLLADTASGGVAFWAHVGGFLSGALLIYIFKDPKLIERHPYYGWSRHPAQPRSWQRLDRR